MAENTVLYAETMNCIERYANVVKTNNDDSDHVSNVFKRLHDQIDYYCNAQARCLAIENLLSESVEQVSCSDNIKDAKHICDSFEKHLKKISNVKDETNPWRNILDKVTGDEEIQMVKSSQSVIDPISKKRLVDPVKNTQCGHTYEKGVVLALIAKNPRTRCPIIGCSAEQYIHKKHLVPNNDLKRYLEDNVDQSVNEEDYQIVSLDDTC